MEGWILLGKNRKCLRLWSMFGRLGLGEDTFFFYTLYPVISQYWWAGRSIPENAVSRALWAVVERVRLGGLRLRMAVFAWWAWMLPGRRCSRRVAMRQAVFQWIPSMESYRMDALWNLRVWGCPWRQAIGSRLCSRQEQLLFWACFRLRSAREYSEWAACAIMPRRLRVGWDCTRTRK